MTSVSCPVAAGGKRVGRGRDGRRNGGREPAKTGKTCQKLTGFRGEIEKNSWKITKSHGAVGYDRNHRQNEENGWKIEGAREPACPDVSRTTRNEGGAGLESRQMTEGETGIAASRQKKLNVSTLKLRFDRVLSPQPDLS